MSDLDWFSLLEQALAAHGLSFDRIEQEASAIALFGSRAHGCETPSSDWDLFCVGHGRSRRLARIDLVWVDACSSAGDAWLDGELAGHVGAYGCWLRGKPFWSCSDVRFGRASRRKEKRLVQRIKSLESAWALLGPAYRDKHATLVRRDIQRLDELSRGVAVPPTALLDAAWNAMPGAARWLGEMLSLLGAEPALAEVMTEHAASAAARAMASRGPEASKRASLRGAALPGGERLFDAPEGQGGG